MSQLLADTSYPTFTDPVVGSELETRWTYWPVSYVSGDPTVISNVPLPLSGAQLSMVMRGPGEFQATLQLADPDVRAMRPWEMVIPRKTGIVAVRETYNPVSRSWVSEPIAHFIVWAAPRDPETGRMTIRGMTVESLWARRLITKAITWTNIDQATIAADLLLPGNWSQVAVGTAPWPGWITVDPPAAATGVTRTFSYAQGQETNLLEAQQNRSQVAGGYEWLTSVRVLSGANAVSANSVRCQFVLGYPRLGRQIATDATIPRLKYDVHGGGNVLSFELKHDGSTVPNIVWGRGNGYEDLQVKAQVSINEWQYGYLQTEDRFSDPDVKVQSTLEQYCRRHMLDKMGSEQFLASLTVRGDLPPFFGSYIIGDDVILETNDPTWPDDYYGDDGFVTLASRIYGMKITPPQGKKAETVELLLANGSVS